MTDWFERITGFRELPWEQTRDRLEVRDRRLVSRADGRSFGIGELALPTLSELRAQALARAAAVRGTLSVSNVSGDVRALHRDPAHAGALFQVASQFNLLEMVSERVTPEHGVTGYAADGTQGPACAIAAGAATIYSNYFVPVDGVPGQTATRQLDALKDVGEALGNDGGRLWRMRNGYAMCTREGLAEIDRRLARAGAEEVDVLRDRLRIGVHRDVEVTDVRNAPGHIVSQAFCSALPVAYGSAIPKREWAAFARLVLEGAYEATLWAAVLEAARGASPIVFLTRLGGGVFGNEEDWIHAAMRRALRLVEGVALDVRIVSHGAVPDELQALASEFGGRAEATDAAARARTKAAGGCA